MDYIKLEDIDCGKKIGNGRTARCYLGNNGDVIKLYKPGFKNYFGVHDDTLKKLLNVKSEYIITPKKLILKNDKIVGYTCSYIDAPRIEKISVDIKIKDLLYAYDTIREEISHFSKNYNIHFMDVHEENVLYNKLFYLIDLDLCYFSISEHENMNQSKVALVILEAIFSKFGSYILFIDKELNEYYKEIEMNYNYAEFIYFIYRLFDVLESEDITIKDVRKNKSKLLRM